MITLKRAYDTASRSDGARFLVERLWPRGVSKDALRLDTWFKDVAPSAGLRTWYGHNPARWTEFRRRYVRELDRRPDAWAPIAAAAKRGTVTFVYAARDTERNSAIVLREYVLAKLGRPARPRKPAK